MSTVAGMTDESHAAGNGRPGGRGHQFPAPSRLSELVVESADQEPLLDAFIMPGMILLFLGIWKAGKSTWLALLARAAEYGGSFMGFALRPCSLLVVTEEGKKHWIDRRNRLGLGDHVRVLVRPFRLKPSFAEWFAFIAYLVDLLATEPADIIVLDTLSNLWPVINENDASEVQRALLPLNQLTANGTALILLHHLNKTDGAEGKASRGSGAIPAFADVIVEFRRFAPSNPADRRRTITSYSRFDDTPPELVIELSKDGMTYEARGNQQEVSKRERVERVRDLLPAAPPGLTLEEIRARWGEDPPGIKTLSNDLPRGVEACYWARTGGGRRGDPFRYHRRPEFES